MINPENNKPISPAIQIFLENPGQEKVGHLNLGDPKEKDRKGFEAVILREGVA